MAVKLRFDQGDTGTVGESRDDVVLTDTITVTAIDAVGTPVFEFLDRQPGSTAVMAGAGSSRTFALNVVGRHRVRVTDDNGSTTHTIGVKTLLRDIAIQAHNEDGSADANEVDSDPGDWVERGETNAGNSNKAWHPGMVDVIEKVERVHETLLFAGDIQASGTAARYLPPTYSVANAGTTEIFLRRFPYPVVIESMRARWDITSNSVSVDWVMRVGGSDSTLTFTALSDDGSGADLDITHKVLVPANSDISLVVRKSAGTGSAMNNMQVTLRATPQ